MKKSIFIGSDHAGFRLKEEMKHYLSGLGYTVTDVGNVILDPEDDYVEFALKVAQQVSCDRESFGILVCDTGSGVTIAANKVSGIRAVNVWNEDVAHYAREHNDANVLCFGEKYVSSKEAEKILRIFIDTAFSSEERHQRRVRRINAIQR
ncbi:MAG: ribose-5-phosphate isomerase [Candidatus Moranbacteria bacterium CG_4_10_14_3_um_filter_45_9]|nr:MAG: hypothetical protein AUK19_01770 [Candidatus Moranbacteria bacterium CG2_30_45_14]PIX89910.1 MAG: ribose-5-phosphate isomerase [Candidatus Moranbacteria bacterium CG_4_10_14_3_um_filter_45_9]PJA85002.1 MAG: ribose-5-phosphate isomerase [Candidatus Moranbacteria bacterium CG_4_9_14_3_um_filter_45_14]